MGTYSYIKNFLKDRKVASITPTSRYTIRRICQHIDFSKDIRILEYGPADGVFTKVLLQKLTPGSELVAIETNQDFAKELELIDDSRLTIKNCSAEEVETITAELNWKSVDYIISGIPFSFIKKEAKNAILKHSASLIAEVGGFLGYQTSSHLKPFLENYFSNVQTEMEYLNIPPMCIYIATNDGSKK